MRSVSAGTRGCRTNIVDRVREARGFGWPGLDVSRVWVAGCQIKLNRRVSSGLLELHCPLLFRSFDLSKVGNAGLGSAGLSCLNKVGHGNGEQNADDQDDDHDLDEGKSLSFSNAFHS